MLKSLVFVFGVLFSLNSGAFLNSRAFAQSSFYVIDGLALGAQVNFYSESYRQYQCNASEFPGLTWCRTEKTKKGRRGEVSTSNTILHKQDGTAVYVNHYEQPAFFSPKEIRAEINRLSARFGERARELPMPQQAGLPNALIAIWGEIQLQQLGAADVATLASGESPHQGILVSFLGDLRRSAKLGAPVFRIAGRAGYIWAATFNQSGRGVLRFLAIDASQIPPSNIGPPPTPAQGLFSWSDCELGRQNPDRSIAACTQILQNGPQVRRAEAFHNRGIAYRAKGNTDQAISDVNEGIRIDPRRPYRFQERGELYFEKGNFGQAIADFNEAIRQDPTRAFRFHWRGQAFAALGNYSLAIDNFSEAIRLDPVKRSFRFYDRADAYRSAGQYDAAISDYDEVLRLDPTNGWAFLDRGRTYAKTGQVNQARSDFEAALRVPGVKPDLRDAVANELDALIITRRETPPNPPSPEPRSPQLPSPDIISKKLSALDGKRKFIEQKLPSMKLSGLRTQADEILAKLAIANRETTTEELDRLGQAADETIKRLEQVDDFERLCDTASRQIDRIKDDLETVVTDAPYLDDINDAIASVETCKQLGDLPRLQSALGNLIRAYEQHKPDIERDRFNIP